MACNVNSKYGFFKYTSQPKRIQDVYQQFLFKHCMPVYRLHFEYSYFNSTDFNYYLGMC